MPGATPLPVGPCQTKLDAVSQHHRTNQGQGEFFDIGQVAAKQIINRYRSGYRERQVSPLNGKNGGILCHYLLAGYIQKRGPWRHTIILPSASNIAI